MKYILSILLLSMAFIVIFPFVAISGLWKFNFDNAKGMWRDQRELVSIDLYKAFKIKTKYLPTHYYGKNIL